MTQHYRDGSHLKFVIIVALVLGGLILSVVFYGGGWGLAEKSFWDWMDLLVIPFALAVGAWWLKREERKQEQRAAIETDSRNLLATYFDRMEDLLLNHHLKDAKRGHEIAEIARARTLHALRSLDGVRKGHVIRFLVDSGLLAQRQKDGTYQSIIRLSYADLSHADLENVHLEGVNLWCANFEGANLKNAHLKGTNLPFAFFKNAKLDHADLSYAYLKDAVVVPAQLQRASHLEEAVMPDDKSYEEWRSSGKPDWTLQGMPTVWTSHTSRYN